MSVNKAPSRAHSRSPTNAESRTAVQPKANNDSTYCGIWQSYLWSAPLDRYTRFPLVAIFGSGSKDPFLIRLVVWVLESNFLKVAKWIIDIISSSTCISKQNDSSRASLKKAYWLSNTWMINENLKKTTVTDQYIQHYSVSYLCRAAYVVQCKLAGI